MPAGATCEPVALPTCNAPPVASLDDVNFRSEIAYSTPFGQQQRLDVAWPKAGTSHGLVLVIHGGGWLGGDKFDHRADILRLAGQGYVAAAINYRLLQGWQNRFPAAISDARCAVRWLRANAGAFAGDPGRVMVIGASAGANSAALLATESEQAGLDDGTCALQSATGPGVTAAVSYYGRMELGRQPIPDYVVQLIGRDGDWMAREALGSPVRAVGRGDAPMLLLHGQWDGTVPIEQSRLMRDALVAAQVPVALLELPGQGHAFPLFGDQGAQPLATCSTFKFLGQFSAPAHLAHPLRTVVYVEKPSVPGQALFLRGGHDLSLVQRGAFLGGSEPIRPLNSRNSDTALVKINDTSLDWFSDSALDWTTDQWPSSWGPVRTYAADGFGVDPENHHGPHYWKFEALMDGAPGDWFEFKTFLRQGGRTEWEGAITQPGAPYVTGNHWARKGYLTVVHFGQNAVELAPLP